VILLSTNAQSHFGGLDEGAIVAIDKPGPEGSATSIDWDDRRGLAGETESSNPTLDTLGQTLQRLDGVFAPIECVLFSPARIRHIGWIRAANLGDAYAVEVNRDSASTSGADLDSRK
jgi:hypothetical protein